MRLQFTLILSFFTIVSFTAWSQENAAVLQGGYSFATVDGTNTQATGWRINGLYEFTPTGGKWALGGSIGYISLSGTESTPPTTTRYDLSSVPIYFAPKFMFGSDKFKGFFRGAIGMHFSSTKRTGTLIILEDNQWGLVFGLGAGGMYSLSEKLFLSAEYEFLWLSNSFYKSGAVNTAALGVGFKF